MATLTETRVPTLPGHLLIDGRLTSTGRASRSIVVNPATEEVLGSVNSATPAQTDDAVPAARRAVDDGPWPQL